MTIEAVYSYACAALALTGALSVVIAANPIRSAMGLLLLILSVAGMFLSLDAQFLAAIQLIVYAGAIVVLFLFVIMLLGPMPDAASDRRGVVARVFGGGLFGLAGLGAMVAVEHATSGRGRMPLPPAPASFGGIDAFGSVLFSDALVPFELSSALLLVAVVGSLAVARGRQGVHSLSKSERDVADNAAPPAAPPRSGVFSQDLHLGESPKEHVS